MEPLREFGRQHAIWGTCAGAIFLSKDARRDQPPLNLMDIKVERNAFGRQSNSFEADLDIPELKKASGRDGPYHAVSSGRRSSSRSAMGARCWHARRTSGSWPRSKAICLPPRSIRN